MAIDQATRIRIEAGEEAGRKLVARFKKQDFTCTVNATPEDGSKQVFQLAHDGSLHTSLSAAGSAVMGGIACNGWRFWTTAEAAEAAAATKAATKAAKPAKEPKPPKPAKAPKAEGDASPKRKPGRPARMIKVAKSQDGVAAHQTRYFCSGCMDTFDAPTAELRPACPQGHTDQPAA
jgi:hypothetical protein